MVIDEERWCWNWLSRRTSPKPTLTELVIQNLNKHMNWENSDPGTAEFYRNAIWKQGIPQKNRKLG